MYNVYESILKSIDHQLKEFNAVKNEVDDDEDFHTISMLNARKKVCNAIMETYSVEYRIKLLQAKLDELKPQVAEATAIVNEYTDGKTAHNVDIVCDKITIKTLIDTRILEDILTPSEVAYMVNKKLTKKILKPFNSGDITYIINVLDKDVDKLTDRKRNMLYKMLVDSFLQTEKNKYENGSLINIDNELTLAKNELDINGMPKDMLQNVYDQLKAYNVIYTMKRSS